MAAAMVAGGAHAAEPIAGSQEAAVNLSLESPRPEHPEFWQRFDFAFDDNANDIFADALQPLNAIRWNLDLPGRDFSNQFRNRASFGARRALLKAIGFGSREAAVELPAMYWPEIHENWFADLIQGSVGDIEEEAVSYRNISYNGLAEAWWRNLANAGTQFGIRPLRTSPYAYVSEGFSDGEHVFLLTNFRYYYDRLANHRFELALSVPVAYGVTLDLGSAYEFASHDRQRFSFKLLKELRGGGIAHIGFEAKGRPKLIAGLTFGW